MRQARGQRGQILAVVALALVALLGLAAFSVDVGYAYYAKRQLQSATDAAALAGAQDLPNAVTAVATATSYAAANTPSNLSFTFTYTTSCTATAIIATGCAPAVNPNQLRVDGAVSTNTWFAKIFGINHFDVTTHANACSPCSSTPVDIVIAVDRTGSMCSPTGAGGTCIDLNNAKDGIRTMMTDLNPPYAQIGMVSFPPVQTTATSPCAAPYNSLGGNGYDGYDTATRGYLTDIINGNYKTGNVLDTSSGLYLHTVDGPANSCIQAGGNTSYSEALRQAQAELNLHGRPNVPDYIVFLTDGEANIGSVYGANDPTYPQGNADEAGKRLVGIAFTHHKPECAGRKQRERDHEQPRYGPAIERRLHGFLAACHRTLRGADVGDDGDSHADEARDERTDCAQHEARSRRPVPKEADERCDDHSDDTDRADLPPEVGFGPLLHRTCDLAHLLIASG